MKGRIKRVAYAGWAGIEYDDFELDDGSFTGLIGNSGAGKTTLLTCFAYALLPDRADLALQPISSVSDPRESGKDPLAAWISAETNYAYVAIDIAARTGKRLVAGIYAEVKGNKADLSPWTIEDVPTEVALRELLVIEDGEEEFTPDFVQLREALAKRGYTLRRHATVPEYGERLYEAGVSPTTLRDRDDRALYGKLIQSSFHGGISAEVASSIKDYILPERPIRDVLLRAEEVTAQVARSKRALEHAQRQIAILHTIFVVGRKATVEATRALMLAHQRAIAAREAARLECDRLVANEASAREAVGSLTRQLEVSNEAHESIKGNLEESIKKLEADFTIQGDALEKCKGELAKVTAQQEGFIAGERVWKRVAGIQAHQTYDAVSVALSAEIEALLEAKGVLEAEKRGLQNEQAALATAAGDPKVTALADRIGGTPLVEALGGVGEQEALRLEVMLGGVTAGLSGVEPHQLERVKPGSDLPPFFWIGEKVPQVRGSTEIGDWIVVRGPDGWFVTDKARRPVFGAAARAARRERLGEAIRKVEERIGQKREDSVRANALRTELLENREIVLTYLSKRESAIELTNEVERARRALGAARDEKLATERALRESRQRLTDAVESHARQTSGLRADIAKQSDLRTQAAEKIAGAQAALDGAEERVASAATDLDEGKAALGTHWTYMAEQAAAPGEYDPVEQTKALGQLGEALADDPSRQRRFEEADARRPSSCLYLWPLLLDVVRNHIPADVADATGEDYLSEMQRKRDFLAKELKGYEDDMREHASSVYEAINSKIREQVAQVKRLSKLAENLQFGNVVGMRVTADRKEHLLQLLQAFSDQGSLFGPGQQDKPFDQVLTDYFTEALDAKVNGEQLLDYRSYMDIHIEVLRSWDAGKWHPSSSLSGGEAIGGGLAITLILFRSLASRGGGVNNIPPGQITPTFVIDEMMRLDDKGQDVAVKFGEQQGFQMLVTAPKLSPDYRCTLWSIDRSLVDGKPNVVIRGVRREVALAA